MEKLGDRLELVVKQQKVVKILFVLKKLLILIFVIMYVKNKLQPVIVIAIFLRNNRKTETQATILSVLRD